MSFRTLHSNDKGLSTAMIRDIMLVHKMEQRVL